MKLFFLILAFLSCEKKVQLNTEQKSLTPMELKLGNDPGPCQKDVPCQID